jgi:hypothetical protein
LHLSPYSLAGRKGFALLQRCRFASGRKLKLCSKGSEMAAVLLRQGMSLRCLILLTMMIFDTLFASCLCKFFSPIFHIFTKDGTNAAMSFFFIDLD